VKAVRPGVLVLEDKTTKEQTELTFGLCVWATGIKMNPLAEQLIKSLPSGSQPNIRSLTVDSLLRVKGSGGTIFALGDAATIELRPAAPHAARMLAACSAAGECSVDGLCVQRSALVAMLRREAAEFPHLKEAADRVEDNDVYWTKTSTPEGVVGVEQLTSLLERMDRALRTLPATAQVAKQQGDYLANLLNSSSPEALRASALDGDGGAPASPLPGASAPLTSFEYRHKGSLAYIGSDSAVADIPGFSILKGILVRRLAMHSPNSASDA